MLQSILTWISDKEKHHNNDTDLQCDLRWTEGKLKISCLNIEERNRDGDTFSKYVCNIKEFNTRLSILMS